MKKTFQISVILLFLFCIFIVFMRAVGSYSYNQDLKFIHSQKFISLKWKSNNFSNCERIKMLGDLIKNHLNYGDINSLGDLYKILGKPNEEFVSSIEPEFIYYKYNLGDTSCTYFGRHNGGNPILFFKLKKNSLDKYQLSNVGVYVKDINQFAY